MSGTEPFNPSPQMEHVRQLIKEHQEEGWDAAWSVTAATHRGSGRNWLTHPGLISRKDGTTPWDAGQAQPPLKDLLDSKVLDLPSTGSAFVPGCGTVCQKSKHFDIDSCMILY